MKIINEVTIYELIIPYISSIITILTAALYLFMYDKLRNYRYTAMLKVILTMVAFNLGYLFQVHFVMTGHMKLAENAYAVSQFGLTFLMPYSIFYIRGLVDIPNPNVDRLVLTTARILLWISIASVPLSFASVNLDFAILHVGTRPLAGAFATNIPRLAIPEVYFSIRNFAYLIIGYGSVCINVYYCVKNKLPVMSLVFSLLFTIPLAACILDAFVYVGHPVILPRDMHFLRLTVGTSLFALIAFVSSISMFVEEHFSIDVLRGELALATVENDAAVNNVDKAGKVFVDVQKQLSDFIHSLNLDAKSIHSSCQISVLYTDSLLETNDAFRDMDEEQRFLYEESRKKIDSIYSSFEVLKKAIAGQAGTLDSIVGEISDGSETLKKAQERISYLTKISNDLVASYSIAKKSMSDSFQTLDSIIEVTSSVKKSIIFIKDISEKTNILAINANIQASKSNRWENSFGMVANEIADLAIDSKIAADRIDDLFLLVTQTTYEFILTKNYIIDVFDSIIDNISNTMLKIKLISNIVSSQLDDNENIHQNTRFARELNTSIAQEIEKRYDEIYDVIQRFDALDEQFEFFKEQLQQQTDEITKLSKDMGDLIVLSKEINIISGNITQYTENINKEIKTLHLL